MKPRSRINRSRPKPAPSDEPPSIERIALALSDRFDDIEKRLDALEDLADDLEESADRGLDGSLAKEALVKTADLLRSMFPRPKRSVYRRRDTQRRA